MVNLKDTKPDKKVNKKKCKKTLKKLRKDKLPELQHKMFAEGEKSVLVVLQGVDAAGKDGTIKTVFGHINPQGCKVKGFGVPTKEEQAHDFLWRIHQESPKKGMIKIFNRSHYEDLIMPLLNNKLSKKEYKQRVEDIKNYEDLLTRNGTTVLKFFLNISHEEQIKSLKERLTNKEKHRKHNDEDRNKSSRYKEYIKHYEKILDDTSYDFAPWHIIPADKNWYKKYLVADTVYSALKSMKMKRPELETDMHLVEANDIIDLKKSANTVKKKNLTEKKLKKTKAKVTV